MSNYKGRPKGSNNKPKPPKVDKKCKICGMVKRREEFNKNKTHVAAYCKVCMSEYRKTHRYEWKPKEGSIYFDESGKIRKEYHIWKVMRHRCSCPTNKKYYLYGGKGVYVCERWSSFENFLIDMGPKPSPRHSLDRFPDKKGNYEPGNVRWATPKQQANNTSQNVIYEVNGISKTLSEWAEGIGVHSSVIQSRIKKWRWPIELAVSTPPLKKIRTKL